VAERFARHFPDFCCADGLIRDIRCENRAATTLTRTGQLSHHYPWTPVRIEPLPNVRAFKFQSYPFGNFSIGKAGDRRGTEAGNRTQF
jgi:hypothetical protein